MSKSKPAAIIVDPEEWNAIAYELEALRHQALCDWVSLEVRRTPDSVTVVNNKTEWMALLDE